MGFALIMKLPLIPHDKANHFIYGFVIFILSNLFLIEWVSLGIVFIFALGKELYDEWKYGGFDFVDLIYTLSPGIILTLINFIK